MAKCNRCKLSIDREREAHVIMPNSEQCGYKSRRPTAFAHASCFEADVKRNYVQSLKDQARFLAEVEAARG